MAAAKGRIRHILVVRLTLKGDAPDALRVVWDNSNLLRQRDSETDMAPIDPRADAFVRQQRFRPDGFQHSRECVQGMQVTPNWLCPDVVGHCPAKALKPVMLLWANGLRTVASYLIGPFAASTTCCGVQSGGV
jgi:hypothetical protein